MASELWKKVFATKCKKDYKGVHSFISIGVIKRGRISDEVIQVHKCEQCNKIVRQSLEEIELQELRK